ncbi:MAG: hypothetical protein M3O30_13155 [Planctomycetota bacterium]|nr:hypothetical protein [Planctomycetota bacterium]
MSPLNYLILLLSATAIAALAESISVYRRRQGLRGLARKWGMHFAMGDRLRLADRIASKLPVAGSANVRVRDLLFCSDGANHRYVFTVEYGLGVVRGKRRRFRVGGFQEPISRGGNEADVGHDSALRLTLAPENLALHAAYSHVRDVLLGALSNKSGD